MADGFTVLQCFLLKRGKSIGPLTACQGKQSLITPAVVFMLPLCFRPSSNFCTFILTTHCISFYTVAALPYSAPLLLPNTPPHFLITFTPFSPTKWDGPFCCRCISTISHAASAAVLFLCECFRGTRVYIRIFSVLPCFTEPLPMGQYSAFP